MMIASILQATVPENVVSIILARTIFGLGFGSSYIAFIIYGSEISSPKVRAQTLFTLHVSLTFGMFLFSTFCMSWNVTLIMQLSGAISAALTFFSTALGYFKLKSSHIFLMQNNSKDALERFQYFQHDSTDNPHVESETMLSFIIEEKKRRFNFFGNHNMRALLVVILVKIGYLSTFNALHNHHRLVLSSSYLYVNGTNFSQLVMMGMRLSGCIIGFLLLDRISKRLQYFIPAIVISLLLIAFGTFLMLVSAPAIWSTLIFFLPLEFAMGVGLAPMADILKGEIFPLKEKPSSIAVAIMFEELLQIVCLAVLYSWVLFLGSVPRTLSFVFGGITLVCGFAVLFLLKDSRQHSLRLVSNLYAK